MFDVGQHLDELRSWPTDRLQARRVELVRVQREARIEELDVLRVLDERRQVDVTVGHDGESARTVREKVETARALETLPAVAAAAHAGLLSEEQLVETVKVADEASDAEWAERAPNMTPADLARKARQRSTPTVEESLVRHAARHFWMRWNGDQTMLQVHGELPDAMGVKFKATVDKLVERMRPTKGEAWERRDRRGADALVQMCDAVEVAEKVETPQLALRLLFCVDVPPEGPVEIAGTPLPEAMVERLRAAANLQPVLVDADGAPLAVGRISSSVSAKILRAVLVRDGHCRCGDCDLRYGLHAHHLRPGAGAGPTSRRTWRWWRACTIRC
jgi:hypothetical protein